MSTADRTRTFDWQNPATTAAKAKSLAGLEFLQGILNGDIPAAPVAKTLDFHPISVEAGKVQFEFMPQEFHFNPIGSVHGGIVSTALDTVMGCAIHSILPRGVAYTTLELKVNFIKAVTLQSGRMLVEGRLIHSGRSTALVEGDVKDENGTLYAHGVSTCMIFNP